MIVSTDRTRELAPRAQPPCGPSSDGGCDIDCSLCVADCCYPHAMARGYLHRHGRWHPIAAMLAIVGIVAHTMVSAFHVPIALAALADPASEIFSAVICSTGGGLKTLTLDADGNPVEAPPHPRDPSKTCPLCAALGDCGLAPPATSPPLEAPLSDAFPRLPADVSSASGCPGGVPHNRGPPPPSFV